ncbi:MAG: hypothetical protein Hyperionvirus21_22 [Hyperionvirus sp.]|uniref:NAD-dependent epimerase/dehydratase domain-containing protein n=1 Tax=Hyperionvirus sp. TaxID=2487770 RepID=A0A3G5AAN6_9VIRU|nr:MAG: hypothetical protein Hyperionvirus21_22 [Hyperionvirus sp.]
MKILVSGCAGFIGSHLCEKLLSRGDKVIGVDIVNDYYDVRQKEVNLEILGEYEGFIFLKENIVDTKAIEIYRPEIVCHLASMAGVRYSIENPMIYCETNIKGQINLLEQCVKCDVKLFVYASSSSVYGLNDKVPFSEDDPINLPNSSYACSKQAMEIYANYYNRLYGISVVGLRFFTVYGPRGRPDMAPFMFMKNIIESKPIVKYGSGESYRDYTYIDDIVNGIVSVLEVYNDKKVCEIYNLGNNKPVSLNQFIEACENVVGKKAVIEEKDEQMGDVPKTYADISKAQRDLGYSPKISIDVGLKHLYQWLVGYNSNSISSSS